MKMTKKKTALLAAFAVSIVALAGVGYAVTGFTSVTVNDSNVVTAGYMKATQGSTYTSTFSGTLELYTYSDADHTNPIVFVLKDGNVAVASGFAGKKIGSTDTITIENKTGSDIATLTFNVTLDGTVPAGWNYYVKLGSTYYALTAGTTGDQIVTLAIENDDSDTITAELYIAGAAFSSFGPIYSGTGWGTYGASTTYTGATTTLVDANVVFTITAAS